MSDKIPLFTTVVFTALLAAGVFYYQAESQERKAIDRGIIVAQPECLRLKTSHSMDGERWTMRFQNICPTRVQGTVCVEERPGKFRLYTSGARIPTFGNFDIFLYGGHAPVSLLWASGPRVDLPSQCGAKTE